MNGFIGLGQSGQQPAGGRRAIRTGTGIFLIAVGAILLFAVKTGSTSWLNVRIVGVILILVGGLGLVLPRRARSPRKEFRRWVVPVQAGASGQPPAAGRPGRRDDGAALVQVQDPAVADGRPTLADDILRFEHDPPL
jgi:hypothetical protein